MMSLAPKEMCCLGGWDILNVENPGACKQAQEKGSPVTTLQQFCQQRWHPQHGGDGGNCALPVSCCEDLGG